MPVAPEDSDKTTFTSYLGTFRYTRMPYGLHNAPATFNVLSISFPVESGGNRT